jgi:pilus assembly protein CpaB
MKSLLVIGLAAGCGLVAAVGAIQQMGQAGAQGIESQSVVIATREININEPLNDQNVQVVEWPRERVPPGTVASADQLDKKLARVRLYPGEPILAGKLMDLDDASTSLKVPLGFRVASVRVTLESSVSNLIDPGDRVDVIMVLREGQDADISLSRTILKAVRVFAVNSEVAKNVEREKGLEEVHTVSLLLEPDQVETLAMAAELGVIKLALRSPDDPRVDETAGCTIDKILGMSSVADETDAAGQLALAARLTAAPPPAVEQTVEPQRTTWQMAVLTPTGAAQYRWLENEAFPQRVGEPSAAAPPAEETKSAGEAKSADGEGSAEDSAPAI